MTRAERNRQAFDEAYAGKLFECEALLERIGEGLKGFGKPAGTVDWGYVGSLAHVEAKLREISDFLFDEGEYAE